MTPLPSPVPPVVNTQIESVSGVEKPPYWRGQSGSSPGLSLVYSDAIDRVVPSVSSAC